MDAAEAVRHALSNSLRYSSTEALKQGELCRKMKKFDMARERYAKSLEIDPTNERTYFATGLLFVDEGKSEEAVSRFDEAKQFAEAGGDPTFASFAAMHAGKILFLEHDLSSAFSRCDESLRLDPMNFEAWYEASRISASE